MGSLISYFAESFPPKPKFSVADIPNLEGKVILVTGGNGGIGYEIIKTLLTKNATVYIASRSREKAEAAIVTLKEETGKEAFFLEVDLASLSSIRRATDELKAKENKLDVLFNNAGVMAPPFSQLTAEDYDLQMGTHIVGPYVLTKRLLPLLIAASNSSSDKRARVINTSSSAQLFANTVTLEAIKDGPARRKVGVNRLYMESKFGTVVLSNELARRYGDKGIVSISLNPGNIKTDLQRYTQGFMKVAGWMFHPVPLGALTPLWAGVSPETAEFNGKYLIPWARLGNMRPELQDPKLGERLWKWLEEETHE